DARSKMPPITTVRANPTTASPRLTKTTEATTEPPRSKPDPANQSEAKP
ncbi:hypothetical protein A2U01_0114389, partial [Trifolium medium]|nr:hypothetical protein [Trifolium medium]